MNDYDLNDLSNALINIGLKKNDNIFVHANLGFFGKLKGISNKNRLAETYYKEIKQIIGKNGNITVPTFTYSFFKNKPFFKNKSESKMGIFAEYVRMRKDSIRSEDPNFSVSSVGPLKSILTNENKDFDTYSQNSFFSKFHSMNGKILNLNFPGSTIIHYYEKRLKVKYRFDKKFYGVNDGKKECWTIFSKYLGKKHTYHNPFPVTKLIRKRSKFHQVLGKGEMLYISSIDFYNIIKKEMLKNKWLLTLKNKKKY